MTLALEGTDCHLVQSTTTGFHLYGLVSIKMGMVDHGWRQRLLPPIRPEAADAASKLVEPTLRSTDLDSLDLAASDLPS